MKKSIIVSLLLGFSLLTQAQVFKEDFSDGNFTSNPIWKGFVALFDASSKQLDLKAPSTNDSVIYLSTSFPSSIYGAKGTTWEFRFKMDVSTSSTNYARFYLMADSSNLLDPKLTGYYVELGKTTDMITLVRKTSTSTTKTIITGAVNKLISTKINVLVKVSRSDAGVWVLSTDTTGTGNNYEVEGSPATDITYKHLTPYGGVYSKYSKTRNTHQHFDDITIKDTASNYPPTTKVINKVVIKNDKGTVDLSKYTPDVENDALTYSIVTNPKNGTATLLGNNIEYTPAKDFLGEDSVKYSVCDPYKCSTNKIYFKTIVLPAFTFNNVGVEIKEDFESYLGTGFSTTTSGGKGNSAIWKISGSNNVLPAMNFNDSITHADYAKGVKTTAGPTSGIYAFNTGGNTIMGAQTTSGSTSNMYIKNTSFTAQVFNNVGKQLDSVAVGYDFWQYNDQDRSNKIIVSYSTDNSTYTPVAELSDTTLATKDGTVEWAKTVKSKSFSVKIPKDSYFYLKWSFDLNSGSGSVDEFGIDNVKLTPYSIPCLAEISPVTDVISCTKTSTKLDIKNSKGEVFLWTTTDGSIISDPSKDTITVSAGGTYTLTASSADKSCTSSKSVTVTADSDIPNVSLTKSGDISCSTPTVTLDGSGSTTGSTFKWSTTEDPTDILGTSNKLSVTNEDQYLLTITKDACSATKAITVNDISSPPVSFSQNITACESVGLNGKFYTSSQVVVDNLKAENGCDSIITTNLTINKNSNTIQNITATSSADINGVTYTTSQTVVDILVAKNSCDSIVTTNLTIEKPVESKLTKDTISVMTYNLLAYSSNTGPGAKNANLKKVIDYANPDILVVEELKGTNPHIVFYDSIMNKSVYGRATYIDDPADSENILFFKKNKFTFLTNTAILTAARNINEYKLIHKVTGDTVRFYAAHLTSSSGATPESKRAAEVSKLREVTDLLPDKAIYFVLGDFNLYKSTEAAYQALINKTKSGYFVDPITMTGAFNDPAYAKYHTQSTRVLMFGGGASGGIDDRFDFILHSKEVAKNKQVKLIDTEAIGNNGNLFKKSINDPSNTSLPMPILDALHFGSDHLPVKSRYIFNKKVALTKTTASICSSDSILLAGKYQKKSGVFYDTLVSVNLVDSVVETTLTIKNSPTVVASKSGDLTCSTTPITLDGTGSATSGVSYLWTTSDGLINAAPTAINTLAIQAGTYKLTVTDNTTGCSDNKSVTVAYSCNGEALDFDGVNDYVNCGSTGLPESTNFTVEAWVYVNSHNSAWRAITDKYKSMNNTTLGVWVSNTNKFSFTTGNGAWQDLIAPNTVNPNTWYHVAAVWDGKTKSIYVDGVLANSVVPTATQKPTSGAGNLTIGGRNNNGEFFNGRIDEVRVWDKDLCAAEIQNNMSCEIPTSSANLVLNYHFNQGLSADANTGVTTLTDASGNGKNGTLVNFALNTAKSNWLAGGGVVTGSACVGTGTKCTTCTPKTTAQNVSACGSALINGKTYTTSQTVVDVLKAKDGCDSTVTTTLTITNEVTSTITITANGTTGVSANGLTANYPFNGNANDVSGKGNNGTINGATLTTDRFGNANSAYTFDGTNSITIAPSSDFDITTGTFSCWYYRTNSNDNDAIFSVRNDFNSSRYSIHAVDNNTGIGVYTTESGFITTPFSFSNNQWYHTVIVFNVNSWDLYINGKYQSSVNQSVGLSELNNVLIGQADNSVKYAQEGWNGKIDDIGIWNIALTDQEISDLYNASTVQACPSAEVTFTAAITNGGSTPAYQWKVNETNAGTNSATFKSSTLNDKDVVTCELTSNATCANPSTVASSGLTMKINAPITTSQNITACGSAIINGKTYTNSQTIVDKLTAKNGCDSTVTTTLTINPLPTISILSKTDPIACGTVTGSITIAGTGTGSLSWSGDAVGMVSSVTLPYTVSNLSVGSYSFVFDVLGCVSNSVNTSLSDPTPPMPTIVASGSTTFCTGESVTLTSSSSTGNSWSTGDITQSISVSTSGNYSVIVSNGLCSSSSIATTVTVNNNVTPTVSIAANSATSVPTNGLVGYWPFNGNANDESGNANNGTVNGATLTTDRFGNANGAYSFDGNVNTKIQVNLSSTITGTKTFSVWFKVPINFINPYAHLITCNNSGNDYLSLNGNHPAYVSSNTVGKFYDGKAGLFSTSSLNDNAWHNIVLIHDFLSQNSTLYVDGLFNGSLNSPNFNVNPIVSSISFGAVITGNIESSNSTVFGDIDDIGIWNRALTDQEVADLYSATTVQACSNEEVTFTAAITNGGTAPSYQWKVNGTNAGTNSATFKSSTLKDKDVVTCELTSNAICANPKTVASLPLAVKINALPTVVASKSGDITCSTTSVTLDGTGSAATGVSYLWSTSDGLINASPTAINSVAIQAGTYKLTVTNTTTGCTDNKSITINSDTQTYKISQNITEVGSAVINGKTYTTSQIVVDKLKAKNGCDSIVTTDIIIKQLDDVVYIPDVNFKAALVANTAINTNGDGEIQYSEAIAFKGFIHVTYKGIADLTGVEAFTALTQLMCTGNQLSYLDVTKNKALTELTCGGNQLSSLDVSALSGLTELSIPDSKLKGLDVSKNSVLTYLNCIGNSLTSLNVANGNNTNLAFAATNNPNLTCIQVDNVSNATAKWKVGSNIDAAASFSLDCNPTCTPKSTSQNVTACDSKVINGKTYTTSQIIVDKLTAKDGCDSTVTTNLTINYSKSTSQNITMVNSAIINGNTYTTSQIVVDKLKAKNGCDSTVTTNLTITKVGNNPPVTSNIAREVEKNIVKTIDLTTIVSDPDNDELTLSKLTTKKGTSKITGKNGLAIEYTPAKDFVGKDTISYSVCDKAPLCTIGYIYLSINEPCKNAVLSGKVLFTNSGISGSKVQLIKSIDIDKYDLVNVVETTTNYNGEYAFSKVSSGDYIIKTKGMNPYPATYFGKSSSDKNGLIKWQNAEIVTVPAGCPSQPNLEINIVENFALGKGRTNIDGIVYSTPTSSTSIVANADVYITLPLNGNVIMSQLTTDKNGKYNFPNLLDGNRKYKVYVDLPGYKSESTDLTISPIIKDITGANFCIDINNVIKTCSGAPLAVEELNPIEANIKLYPNPFITDLNLEYTLNEVSDVTIEIVSVLGNKVYETQNKDQNVGNHKLNIVSNINATGVYNLLITINNKRYATRIVKMD